LQLPKPGQRSRSTSQGYQKNQDQNNGTTTPIKQGSLAIAKTRTTELLGRMVARHYQNQDDQAACPHGGQP
jgi:hypothetical protein